MATPSPRHTSRQPNGSDTSKNDTMPPPLTSFHLPSTPSTSPNSCPHQYLPHTPYPHPHRPYDTTCDGTPPKATANPAHPPNCSTP
eukprot:12247811-Alexandrium_andersonii.AAC.1